jgi:uncharacterized protein (DUF58 family)
MSFPPATLDKWELSASLALGLCAVAHGDGDPVGLAIAHGDGPWLVPPRTRRGTVANVMRLLLEIAPAGSPALAPVLALLRSSRRIAIVSDFLGDTEAVLAQARELVAAGREVVAVHVVAREELDPTTIGTMVVDPEDAAIRRPLDGSGVAEYKATFARWRRALADEWRRAGAVYQLATTDDAPERMVRRIVAPPVVSAAS